MIKILGEIKRCKEQGLKLRPIWQIIILIPLYLIYLPANAFVEWMDTL